MAFRKEAESWGWALLLAMPGAGAFLLARMSSGWLSTLAWVILFAYVALLIVTGFFYEVRMWAELEDDLDRREQETRDSENR
jgi:fatty acid desaturase